MFDWLKIKTSLADARSAWNNMRSTIATNKLRIEELRNLPLPRQELVDLVTKFIDDVASCYPKRLSDSLTDLIQNPVRQLHTINNDESCMREIRVLTNTGHPGVAATAKTIETALFYLLGDQLKASVRKAVQEMEYPTIVGPAMSIRLAEIDKLTKENAELEAKVKAMEIEFAALSVDAAN